MSIQRLLAAVGLVAILMVFVGARNNPATMREGRPSLVEPGVILLKVVETTGTINPERYRVEDVDGTWIKIQVLKKKNTKKGSTYWVDISNFGAFTVQGG